MDYSFIVASLSVVLLAPTPSPPPEIIRVETNAYCAALAHDAGATVRGILINDVLMRDDTHAARQVDMSDQARTSMAIKHIYDSSHGMLANADRITEKIDSLRAVVTDIRDADERARISETISAAEKAVKAQRYIANSFITVAERADMNLMALGDELEQQMTLFANPASEVAPGSVQSPTPAPDADIKYQNPAVARPRYITVEQAARDLASAEQDLSVRVVAATRPCVR